MVMVSYGSISPVTVVVTSDNMNGQRETTKALSQPAAPSTNLPSCVSIGNATSTSEANVTVPPISSGSYQDNASSANGDHQPSLPSSDLPSFVSGTTCESRRLLPNGDEEPLRADQDEDVDLILSRSRAGSVAGVTAGAVANLCSATLGAGVLALPFALRQAGLVVGLILLLGAASATVASVGILVQAHSYYGHDTYESLAQAVVSSRCRHAVEASLLVFCAGCAVAYVIAVGDIAHQAGMDTKLSIHGLSGRTTTLLIAYVTAMLPLSLLRRVQSLQCASCFSIIAIMTLVVASFLHWLGLAAVEKSNGDDPGQNETMAMLLLTDVFASPNESETPVQLSDFFWPEDGLVSILTACPIVLFAFSCQANVCSIYHELSVPSAARGEAVDGRDSGDEDKRRLMRRVAVIAVGICAALYGSISLIALADFGKNVQSNMLSCYVNAGPVMECATAAMAVAIILAFPLNIFPARVTLLGLIAKHCSQSPSRQLAVTQATVPNEGLTAALLQDEAGELNHTNNDTPERHVDHTFSDHVIHLSIHGVSDERFSSSANENADRHRGENDDEEFNLRLHVGTTVFLTGMTLILAIILPNISVVFGLLGGTASSILGFCVPGLLGIRMSRDLEEETGQRHRRMLFTSWLLVCGGVAVGCLTTGVTIYTTVIRTSRH